MTLDEAIKHAEEVTEAQMKSAEMWKDYSESKYESHLAKKAYNNCVKCAEEHLTTCRLAKRIEDVPESVPCATCT